MKTRYKKRPLSQRIGQAFDEYVVEPMLDRMKPKKHTVTENMISLFIGAIIGALVAVPVILKEPAQHKKHLPETYMVENVLAKETEPVVEVMVQEIPVQEEIIPEEAPATELMILSDTDLENLAKCVEAEAGGEGEFGKRLVIDVIFNRMDSRLFPGKTVTDIIFQKNQFAVVNDGRMEKAKPTQETYDAIAKELECRSYPGLLYFTSEGYSPYGTPWKKIGGHYFSTAK